jgi:hypothetical protein
VQGVTQEAKMRLINRSVEAKHAVDGGLGKHGRGEQGMPWNANHTPAMPPRFRATPPILLQLNPMQAPPWPSSSAASSVLLAAPTAPVKRPDRVPMLMRTVAKNVEVQYVRESSPGLESENDRVSTDSPIKGLCPRRQQDNQ